MRWLLRLPSLLFSKLMIGMVRGYQLFISPLLPKACRFEPSCSEYFILAVQKHGPIKGGLKGGWRICRCNPWGGHGADLP